MSNRSVVCYPTILSSDTLIALDTVFIKLFFATPDFTAQSAPRFKSGFATPDLRAINDNPIGILKIA